MAAQSEDTPISDERMFRQWLESREHGNLLEFGPLIAHRASLRALAVFAPAFRVIGFDLARTGAFWAITANLVFRAWRSSPDANFAEAAKFAQVGSTNAAEQSTSYNIRLAAVSYSAADVAKIITSDFARVMMEDVAGAVSSAADSLENLRDFWMALDTDIRQLQSGLTPLEVMSQPLWHSEPPATIGLDIGQLRRNISAENADWAVLVDWYEARVEGKAGSWGLDPTASVEMERRIASGGFEPGFWRRSLDEITRQIADWLREAGWGRSKGPVRSSAAGVPPKKKTAATKQAIKKPVAKKGIKAQRDDVAITVSVRQDPDLAKPDLPEKESEPTAAAKRADLEPLADTVDGTVDHLGRANIAYALAGRINEVWDQMNLAQPGNGERPSASPGFVIHIDAPWGGGKSTFAEQIARILNPYAIKGALPTWLKALPIGKDGTWPERFRRPWHIVRFNAWQHQHVSPPWWVFYETIRETVTRQQGREANLQAETLPPPLPDFAFKGQPWRWLKSAFLKGKEYAWRLFSPSLWFALIPLVLTVLAIYLLVKLGVIQTIQKDGKFEIGLPNNATGFIATTAGVILGGGAALWRLWSAFTQTLLPGTPDAAKNFSLGSGDPLKRMKAHFVKLMEDVHRPVLVIVDDLDRCEPAFVVELVRGMQTILASPRVVYLLLGDRDWIEQSFTEVHKAMKGVEVGPEHRFGGRFVEKAIQFSMVLPDISEKGRQDYVRQLLTSGGKVTVPTPVTAPPSVLETASVPESQRATVEALKSEAEEVLKTEDYEQREQKAKTLADKYDLDLLAVPKQAFEQEMAQKLFFRAATDSTAERATSHMIEGMAPILPANPRQIKRIINTLSLLGQVLRITDPAKRPGSADWQVLARWVVLMVEWPKSWFTLSRHRGLADLALAIAQGKSEAEIDIIENEARMAGLLPASGARATAKLIATNKTVMSALNFHETDWAIRPINSTEIRWLSAVMPAASGQVLQPPQQEKAASSDPAAAGKGG